MADPRPLPAIRHDTLAELLRYLEQARKDVAARLASANIGSRAKLREQQAEIERLIGRFAGQGARTVVAGQAAAWQAGQQLGVDVPLRINERTLKAMQLFTTGKMKDVGVATVDKVNAQLAQVVLGTKPSHEAIAEVDRLLGGKMRRRAMTIVYTEVGRAHAAAQYEAMLEAERMGVRIAKRWVRSQKLHPRVHHAHAHNQIKRVSEPFEIVDKRTGQIEQLRFPRDPLASIGNTINCGCTMQPLVNGSTFGASVIEVPADPKAPVRKIPLADYEAQLGRERVEGAARRAGKLNQLAALDPAFGKLLAKERAAVSAIATPAQSIAMNALDSIPEVPFRPQRRAWMGGGEVLIHNADELVVRSHPRYADAKAGDPLAAITLVDEMLSQSVVEALRRNYTSRTVLLPVVAEESEGTNAIPLALASRLSGLLGWEMRTVIVQANVAARTRKDGYYRLAIQPVFDGPVEAGRDYMLVDDFIGQGATLANLRGHILAGGGQVVGYNSLTGKSLSATLALRSETLAELRRVHGTTLENWWRQVFGFGFESLTESEARYLIERTDADRVRDRIAKALRKRLG